MAMRSAVSRSTMFRLVKGNWRRSAPGVRCFSDGQGRVLDEEERAREAAYIKKMEREKMEKAKKKIEQEKAGKDTVEKVILDPGEGAQKS